MTGIYLLLGSNLGDREHQLARARELLDNRAAVILQSSSIYASPSWGIQESGDFLNQVLEISTKLSPHALLYQTLSIEVGVGRQFQGRMQDRHIDIDILYYRDTIINSDLLTLPHARIAERRFVLTPMAEIAPQEMHPVLNLSQKQLLHRCPDHQPVTRVYN